MTGTLMSLETILRRVRFAPYRKGMGPTFALTVWLSSRIDRRGDPYLGYRLTMNDNGKRSVLFEGEDFGRSPMHAIDSDVCVAALMGFLTLRPGDTDAEYFDGYTDAQRDFAAAYAEALSAEVSFRFSED